MLTTSRSMFRTLSNIKDYYFLTRLPLGRLTGFYRHLWKKLKGHENLRLFCKVAIVKTSDQLHPMHERTNIGLHTLVHTLHTLHPMYERTYISSKRLALGNQRLLVRLRQLAMCRGETSAVIARLMSKCL